jgi:hypothetical protein
MGSPNLVPIPSPDDKMGIVRALRKLASLRLNADSSPTFAELTLIGDLNVSNINADSITTGYIDFDLNPSVSGQEGRVFWNTNDGTINIGMPGGMVNLQVGQEILIRARNTTGTLIPNGSVVRIAGASGGKPLIELADADDINTGATGLATEDIANNSNGYIGIKGLVRDVDTNAYAPGSFLFMSSTAGGFTNIPPTGNRRVAFIGTVIVQGSSNGVILLQPQNSSFLSGLSGVEVTSVADGEVLRYDSVTSTWKNAAVSGGITAFLGLTDTPSDYTGEALKLVRVNTGEDALEFVAPSAGVTDHGVLTGLTDDDHTQYLLIDGTRAMSGDLDMDSNDLIDTGCISPDTDEVRDLGSAGSAGEYVLEIDQPVLQSIFSSLDLDDPCGSSFTTSGPLDVTRIAPYIYRSGTQSTDIQMDIYLTSGGYPTGPSLGTAVVPYGDVPLVGGAGFINFDFDMAVSLDAATQYIWVLSVQEPGWSVYYSGGDEGLGGNFSYNIIFWTHNGKDGTYRIYSGGGESSSLLRYKDVYLSGNLSDGTDELTVAEAKEAYDHSLLTVEIDKGGTGEVTAQAAIDALSAVSGATDEHVLTKDTGTGNAVWKAATGGADASFGYEDRGDPDSTDFEVGDLTADGTWHTLDLSSIVADGASAINIKVVVEDDLVGSAIKFRMNGNTNTYATSNLRTQRATSINDATLVVPVDENQVCEYWMTNVTFTQARIVVLGWWKSGIGLVTEGTDMKTKTADYQLVTSDRTILVDTSSNAVTITLPASPSKGEIYTVKCIDATNTCTVARNGNNIDGAAADITLLVTESATFQFDSTYGWAIL